MVKRLESDSLHIRHGALMQAQFLNTHPTGSVRRLPHGPGQAAPSLPLFADRRMVTRQSDRLTGKVLAHMPQTVQQEQQQQQQQPGALFPFSHTHSVTGLSDMAGCATFSIPIQVTVAQMAQKPPPLPPHQQAAQTEASAAAAAAAAAAEEGAQATTLRAATPLWLRRIRLMTKHIANTKEVELRRHRVSSRVHRTLEKTTARAFCQGDVRLTNVRKTLNSLGIVRWGSWGLFAVVISICTHTPKKQYPFT